MKEKRIETAMKRIHSSAGETNKHILDIMKRQRTSEDTERTYIYVKTMYLTLQGMENGEPTWKEIIQRMVQTTLAVDTGKGTAHVGKDTGRNDEDGSASGKEDGK